MAKLKYKSKPEIKKKIKEYSSNEKNKKKREIYRKSDRGKEIARRSREKPLNKYKNYKNNANITKKHFDISFEYFTELLLSPCIYCGTERSNGIDRVVNSIGYIPGNCISCCSICNFMKGSRITYQEFIDKCKQIANMH